MRKTWMLVAAALVLAAVVGIAMMSRRGVQEPTRSAVPQMALANFDQLPRPLPLPYDEKLADPWPGIAAAKARAKADGKLLLIDLGGNWCGDCRVLAATMEQPELEEYLAAHYETVIVDVGRFTRNMDVPEKFGAGKPKGVPALLIVDPATDRLLNAEEVTALASAREMTPQALAAWFGKWVKA